jgi:hypothetical protein
MSITRYGFTPDFPLLVKKADGDYVEFTDYQADKDEALRERDAQIALLTKRSESDFAEIAQLRAELEALRERESEKAAIARDHITQTGTLRKPREPIDDMNQPSPACQTIPRDEFDQLARAKQFKVGPFISSFGDGPGEPYVPQEHRSVWGVLKDGQEVRAEGNHE